MSMNGIEGAAVQSVAGRPPEKVLRHIGVTEPQERVDDKTPEASAAMNPPRKVSLQIYNSHGEVVPSPSTAGTDFKA
jgi:hypothetical protein